jgi:pyruvate-formate lyase-activating enzyme
MPTLDVLEPAIDPNNRISFLLDWELTMKCNLDCSYCGTDLYGGHDNSTKHPPLEECLETLDFLFAYVDLYMKYKPAGIRYAVLNVYGGESLHHPNIIEILSEIQNRYQPYKDRWHLTVTTTTNAIVSNKTLLKIIPYIDEFTVSYHTEATDKQKKQFKDNLLIIQTMGKRLKCVVLMHDRPDYFEDGKTMITWLSEHNIKFLPRQLDDIEFNRRNYNKKQVQWFNNLYQTRSYSSKQLPIQIELNEKINLADTGRACCGGRQVCEDQNYKERKFYVLDNKFPDWYCSVNWFFVAVKQLTREIFVNKDCKMKFDGTVGAIGTLDNSAELLAKTAAQLDSGTMPIIQCKKYNCFCGLCAPKAKELNTYNQIITKYQKDYQ